MCRKEWQRFKDQPLSGIRARDEAPEWLAGMPRLVRNLYRSVLSTLNIIIYDWVSNKPPTACRSPESSGWMCLQRSEPSPS